MTERELLYVKTIADERSISKAAEKLFLSQPSLSKCVQKIEESLGTKLFKRTNTGLVLTFAGERYYKVATQILRLYNDFEIEVGDINNFKKGRITFGITIYLATLILPDILPIFRQHYPNIEVCIEEKNTSELEKSLSSGEIDFAVMHTSPAYELSDNLNIDFYPIYRDQFLLAARKGHPLGKHAVESKSSDYPRIDIRLFEKEPFIMLSRWQRIRQVSDMILERAGVRPNVAFTTKSYETARRLACEGLGVAFVPEQYLQIFPGINDQDYYSMDEALEPYWDLCVAIQKNVYVPKAAQAFIRMVNDKYGSAPIELVNDNTIR